MIMIILMDIVHEQPSALLQFLIYSIFFFCKDLTAREKKILQEIQKRKETVLKEIQVAFYIN